MRGGWTVTGELQGWSFQLEPVAGSALLPARQAERRRCGS